jgi:hypothetical protein
MFLASFSFESTISQALKLSNLMLFEINRPLGAADYQQYDFFFKDDMLFDKLESTSSHAISVT